MSRMTKKSRTLQLLSFFLLPAMTNLGLAAAADSPKTRYNLKLFEGDIVPEYSQILECYGADTTEELVTKGILSAPDDDDDMMKGRPQSTTLGSDYYHMWPSRVEDVTVIPYEFAKGAFGAAEQSIIENAMQDLARQVSVVQFVPRRSSTKKNKESESSSLSNLPYLRFTADQIHRDNPLLAEDPACWTHVGWQGGSHQAINVGTDFCVATGPVQHLLLHTLGMWHLSSRWDRDDYVTIVWKNVGLEYYFHKRIVDDTLGFPYYDYDTIMSFTHDDYSKNGNDTILSPEPIGQLGHLSVGDVLWVRLLYQCRSGPRVYGEYLAHPCTEDCPCWQQVESSGHDDANIESGVFVAMKCHGNDAACQGSLVCSSQTDRCVRPSGTKAETLTMQLVQDAPVVPHNRLMIGVVMLVAIACFSAVLLLSLMRASRGAGGLIARRYRRNYEAIP